MNPPPFRFHDTLRVRGAAVAGQKIVFTGA